jgi:hypothetical protein
MNFTLQNPIAFTEQPAPSQEWMAGGGHESFDPFTARALLDSARLRSALGPTPPVHGGS